MSAFTSPKIRLILRILLKIGTILLIIALLLAAYLFFKPVPVLAAPPAINAITYQESQQAVSRVQSQDSDQINPVCRTKLYDHGIKVKRVIVLFHGFTNCPAQFDILAQQMFDQGYNVYVPRLPHHGLQDRLTDDLENLTTAELTDTVRESIQLSTGLGEEITLFGISGGSVMAAWGGYYYPQVNHVFVAAPLFAPADLREWQLRFVYNLLDGAPSTFQWWDDSAREKVEGPSYAYPRFSLRAMRTFLNLSLDLYSTLGKPTQVTSQAGKKLTLLTSENDPAVNNTVAGYMIDQWAKVPGTTVVKYQFPASLGLKHDFIDPNQTTANIKEVYPKILKLVE